MTVHQFPDRPKPPPELVSGDNGMRVVLCRDPRNDDHEHGWYAYGPFSRESAATVAADLAVAYAANGIDGVTVELIGWEAWQDFSDETEGPTAR